MSDQYSEIADYYDYMLPPNPEREGFFRTIFARHRVRTVLDCACGTGQDLLLFDSLGCRAVGSDISDAMLKVAAQKLSARQDDARKDEMEDEIQLKKADFHRLDQVFSDKFDAVVCLSNAVNEADVDALQALRSMKSVLRKDGIIIFDQGQTDFTMKNPPAFAPVVNGQDLSRLFTMHYHDDLMEVDIFDFLHQPPDGPYDFRHSRHTIRIRLYGEWVHILDRAGLTGEFFGGWDAKPYDPETSQRLIVVARPKN